MTDVQHLSSTDRWFTPLWLIEAARDVLGGIDLDPASEPLANERVRASRWLGEGDDALAETWTGRVFLNPPGGAFPEGHPFAGRNRPLAFWDTLSHHHAMGDVQAAIFVAFKLDFISVGQGCHRPPPTAFPICTPRSRIRFDRPDGSPGEAPRSPSAIVYLGPERHRFARRFAEYGAILQPFGGGS